MFNKVVEKHFIYRLRKFARKDVLTVADELALNKLRSLAFSAFGKKLVSKNFINTYFTTKRLGVHWFYDCLRRGVYN